MSYFKTFLVLAFLAPGCVYDTGYGDGRLIQIHTDSLFSAHEKELVKEACHIWDVWGVQYRTSDEVAGGEYANIQINRSDWVPPDDTLAVTYQVSNQITVYTTKIFNQPVSVAVDGGWVGEPDHDQAFVNVVAHELGHTMGLDHVRAEYALMHSTVLRWAFVVGGLVNPMGRWIGL